jgi:hypothetical protein
VCVCVCVCERHQVKCTGNRVRSTRFYLCYGGHSMKSLARGNGRTRCFNEGSDFQEVDSISETLLKLILWKYSQFNKRVDSYFLLLSRRQKEPNWHYKSPQLHPITWHLPPGLQSWLFSWHFPTKSLYVFLVSLHAAWPDNIILIYSLNGVLIAKLTLRQIRKSPKSMTPAGLLKCSQSLQLVPILSQMNPNHKVTPIS